MSLIQKTTTPEMAEANRENSRKSTGPRTELGKRCASHNAGKVREIDELLAPYGAEVVVCPGTVSPDHPDSYYSVSTRLAAETPATASGTALRRHQIDALTGMLTELIAAYPNLKEVVWTQE